MHLPSLHPGATVAGYRLVRPLGEGGMGSVWLVVPADSRFGEVKEFALKLVALEEGARNRAQVEALVNEGRAVSRVRHTNVVSLYKLDCDDRYYMAAMEYIAGITFRDLVTRVRERGVDLPPSLVVDLALGACRGLGAAHDAVDPDGRPLGLVHRDVKPTNLMLAEDGTVKVVDFGIAKAATNLSETSSDTTKGTPYYMSPEQWRHERLTPASDLFSLGAVISELVTGKVLFHAPGLPQVVTRLMKATAAEDAGAVRERVPALAPIVEQCLERELADRYRDAGDLERDLLAVRARLPAPVDLAVVARLLGLGKAVKAAAPGLAAGDADWTRFLAAFDGSRPAETPTVGAASAGRSPTGGLAAAATGVSVPTLHPRTETQETAGRVEHGAPGRDTTGMARAPGPIRWPIVAAAAGLGSCLVFAAGWWMAAPRRSDPGGAAHLDPMTPSPRQPHEVEGEREAPPLIVGEPGTVEIQPAEPEGGTSPPSGAARPVGPDPVAGPHPAPAPSVASGKPSANATRASPAKPAPAAVTSETWRAAPAPIAPEVSPPATVAPPALTVVVDGPKTVEMGRRATFRVTVGPDGACSPALEIAPGRAGSDGGGVRAQQRRQEGASYTFAFDVPYDGDLYGLGLRYRATCSAPDGRVVRWPEDGTWRTVRASL